MNEHKLRILVLEDGLDDAVLMERALQRAQVQFQSRREETRAGFLQALDEFKPDLILADYSLPQFTALDALDLLRERRLNTPFVLVTGSQSHEMAVTCLQRGADDYVFKSGLDRLAAAVADSRRKRAEEALHQMEVRLNETEHLAQVGNWEVDLEKGTLTWSEETYRIFGVQPDEFVLTVESFYERLHPVDREPAKRMIEQAVRAATPQEIDYRLIRPDGSQRWVRARAERNATSSGRALRISGTIQDITERRHLREQFHRAQKMEIVGILAGGLAHDFNNLLTVVRGRTEMLLSDEKLSVEGVESLQQVMTAVDRAAGLTRQLVNLSRSHTAQPEPLDVNAVVTNLAKMLRRIVGQDVRLDSQLASALPLVQADQSLLEQAILNLAVYVRESMIKGTLRISTQAVTLSSELPVSFPRARPGRYVRLTFQMVPAVKGHGDGLRLSDSGPGFSEAAQTHSLALAAAQGIVEQHHGWIEARSESAAEREFHIFLPGPTEATSAELAHSVMPGLRGSSERLLLVEEDQGLRRFVTLLLQRLGYVVQETATISEALKLWQENQGAFDLLLVDLSGSRENQGWELLDQLRKEKPTLGAVVMASSKAPSDRPRLLSERTRLLTKPFVPEALAQLIRECLSVQ